MDRKLPTHLEEIKVKVNLNTKLLHALMKKLTILEVRVQRIALSCWTRLFLLPHGKISLT